jgi:glycosyltransferase involved in cell wall biosynthesis
MRIAQVSTLAAPVRAESAGVGSVEGLVWTLADHLTRGGHEVTVFGAAGSDVPGELVATLPGAYGAAGTPDDWQLCEWINLSEAVRQSERFDVVHCHAYLWGLPLGPLSRSPLVHSMHVWPYTDAVLLRRSFPSAVVIAPSRVQWMGHGDLPPARIVPHGVDPDFFQFQPRSHDSACYLGRFIPGKGPRHAMAAAREAGIDLVMAGPSSDYFVEEVAPAVDGRTVRYVGPVDGPTRPELLGSAGVLLAPFQAPEPFCLVLVEAMMCGTPVVTTTVGAAPEVVDPGLTGYCATQLSELPALMHAALALDRSAVRARAEERFSAALMVERHLEVYREAAG